MSSTMASAVKNTLSPTGALSPSNAKTPRAKAMSVAMGMPQPAAPSVPALMARYISAGTTAPPTAAATGSAAPRTEDSSPTSTSRLISRPTTKKNTAISPSLIQWVRSLETESSPTPTVSLVCHSAA